MKFSPWEILLLKTALKAYGMANKGYESAIAQLIPKLNIQSWRGSTSTL